MAKPIIINFQVPIADQPMAERAIHVSSIPPVPGKFYWMSPTQVRWRPLQFWPANTAVNIDAAGTKSSFRTGDSLVATADDATHQMTITRNGTVVQTFPMSMGMSAGHHQTPNGTYYVLEKMPSVVMDSSTYGVRGRLVVGLQGDGQRRRPDRQQRQLRAQRAVVGRRPGQARRQPRLHQPQPHQREVVLRQLRQRRSRRGEELRRFLHPERRRPRLADVGTLLDQAHPIHSSAVHRRVFGPLIGALPAVE